MMVDKVKLVAYNKKKLKPMSKSSKRELGVQREPQMVELRRR